MFSFNFRFNKPLYIVSLYVKIGISFHQVSPGFKRVFVVVVFLLFSFLFYFVLRWNTIDKRTKQNRTDEQVNTRCVCETSCRPAGDFWSEMVSVRVVTVGVSEKAWPGVYFICPSNMNTVP